MQAFEKDFAPTPPGDGDLALQTLLDLLGLGALAVSAAWFNQCEYTLANGRLASQGAAHSNKTKTNAGTDSQT